MKNPTAVLNDAIGPGAAEKALVALNAAGYAIYLKEGATQPVGEQGALGLALFMTFGPGADFMRES